MEINSLQKINDEICSFLQGRLTGMGGRIGGLYNYYVQRLKTGEILSKEDKEIIEYVQREISLDANILEVGGGIGQLGHSLALLGYRNTTICEFDLRRRDACIALGKQLGSKAVITGQKFPDCCHKTDDIILIANVVNGCNDLEKDIFSFQDILTFSDILFIPALYDEAGDYEHAIFLFEKLDMKYTIIKNGLILLKRTM